MGDGFFKIFFISTFVLLFLAGAIMFFSMEKEASDARAERAFIQSRGKAPIPPGWRDKLGSGI